MGRIGSIVGGAAQALENGVNFRPLGDEPGKAEAYPAAGPESRSETPLTALAVRDIIVGYLTVPNLVFALGFLAVMLPTLTFVARETWVREEGAHGPIVLMTGLWLLWRKWPSVRPLAAMPPGWRVGALLTPLLLLFMLARITHIVEIEGYVMYAALLVAIYGLIGGRAIAKLTFPLIYLAFMFPPPETVIYALTMPMKVAISESAIALLKQFGYPIGGTGVTIQIGQYQLLVAAACSGLNSIVSLSALTVFYIYVRHSEHIRYAVVLLLFVIPVAVVANFIRVLILILLTYHAGEATAQSFVHDLAGLTMFALALMLIFLVDRGLSYFLERRQATPPVAQAAQ